MDLDFSFNLNHIPVKKVIMLTSKRKMRFNTDKYITQNYMASIINAEQYFQPGIWSLSLTLIWRFAHSQFDSLTDAAVSLLQIFY